MMYDVPPEDYGAPAQGFTLDTYKKVLELTGRYVDKSKIIMGFMPGNSGLGSWEGMAVDKEVIRYIEEIGYGGVMFWAMNEAGDNNGVHTGELAEYARNKFKM